MPHAASCATVLLLVDEDVWLPLSGKLVQSCAEAPVEQSLRRFAERVVVRPFVDVAQLLRVLDEAEPDVVFNLTQLANGERSMDAYVCAVLELRGVAYTGTGARGLMLCRDKALSKTIAASAGFAVPEFFLAGDGPVRSTVTFPLVVKPRFGDASEGIDQASLVRTHDELAQRVAFLRASGYRDIICEQFVPGRELAVGVVGERVVLPPLEYVVGRSGRGAPLLACRRLKYDGAFRERRAISTAYAELTLAQTASLTAASLRACAALDVRDYGRLDVKLAPSGAWVFLEANPNPGLRPGHKSFSAAGGLGFDALIEEITQMALARSATPRRPTAR
jgi:D-alanine-D-alanine ligase